ncbi:MAG: hypothetical protein LUD72_13795 [Bacteroidales bacterium]|nr:hypothetical protein [Bacteroidales bacterium]
MKTIPQIISEVYATKARGKWNSAVKGYAIDLLGNLWDMFVWDRDMENGSRRSDHWMEEHCCNARLLHKKLLNGAPDWHEYSWGGCALIYNDQLAKNLLTKSEQKSLGWKEDSDGRLYGGRSEWRKGTAGGDTLLDAQARALLQAEAMIAGLALGGDSVSEIYATSLYETKKYYG